jgi:hypothetical protein
MADVKNEEGRSRVGGRSFIFIHNVVFLSMCKTSLSLNTIVQYETDCSARLGSLLWLAMLN